MKNKSISALYFAGISLFLIGCNVRIPSETSPKPSYYGEIDNFKTMNGYPEKPMPWVVLSDRDNNTVFMDKGDETSPRSISFMEPLFVTNYNKSKGMVRVAQYNPDALLQKVPAKSVKTYGWIPEDQLLLWTSSIKNFDNGFNLKATLVPSSSDVLNNADKYLKNDSVMVFTAPDLVKPAKVKLPVGQMVYVYKKAENARRFLIGRTPSVKIDSVKGNIYGWVSSNMLALWGDRSAIRLSPEYAINNGQDLAIIKNPSDTATSKSFLKVSDIYSRTPTENLLGIYPKELRKENKSRFFTNSLDFSKNFIYNVTGQPLYFNRYREIINNNKKLNIIFTLDISNENTQNTGVAKSVFQDFQMKLNNMGYYTNIKFGAVLYKNNSCGDNIAISDLTTDYSKVARFIDEKSSQQGCTNSGGQPMQEGLDAAGELLAPYHDETNIVVLVGSTAQSNKFMGSAIRSLSAARARIISYQSVAGPSDLYTNFVLLSENLVTNTAKNIAEIEKERFVDQGNVMNRNNYSLQGGEDGVFSLDYPKTSMSQGFVIYPKKGDLNSNTKLAKALELMFNQITDQNKKTDEQLTAYFKSPNGSSRTEMRTEFANLYPDTPPIIPVEAASQLIKYNSPFLAKGNFIPEHENYYPLVQKGILVSEKEYDDLKKLYLQIYSRTEPFSKNFDKSKAVRAYLNVLKENHLTGNPLSRIDMLKKNMAYSVARSTGFDNYGDDLLTKYTLSGWKKSKEVPEEVVKEYFNQYKILAERLLDNKGNSKIIIDQGGEKFYWLNAFFMPQVKPKEILQ